MQVLDFTPDPYVIPLYGRSLLVRPAGWAGERLPHKLAALAGVPAAGWGQLAEMLRRPDTTIGIPPQLP